ncbi:heterokaryon incompatibility protein-domain-containing protein [Xylariaceae sp. FL0594]|nr:heterokaryon incompatibility protein-domain-containing protein [Xylariaceae sp. FL0594]
MRLLNTTTHELGDFLERERPKYAILSHTWESEEVLYQHIVSGTNAWRRLTGAAKIRKACEVALLKGYDWIWIDTCCIDKSSSSELSESIHSMFRWYEQSGICIAYLADISKQAFFKVRRKSRWFTRGWTLQELIAPREIEFFDSNWVYIDNKKSLRKLLAQITGIPAAVLKHADPLKTNTVGSGIRSLLAPIPVANIMSWAAMRETTRPEDMTYCLLGLFDIDMPLLYGEGGVKAFIRAAAVYHDGV